MNTNSYYVYLITRNDTGEACYVGKGKGQRSKLHAWRAQNPHLANIVSKHGITVIKLFVDLTEEQAYALEIKMIGEFKRTVDGGTLVNMTLGGDGTNGYRVTEAHKAALRAAHKGKKFTEEHRQKISNGRKGIVFSDETKAKMRAAKVGRVLTEEHKAKIRKSCVAAYKPRVGYVPTSETRAKASASLKAMHAAKAKWQS